MSKRRQVGAAVRAMLETAMPFATVIGLAVDEAKPERVPPDGLVIVRWGDPGPAEIDLSPPGYNYDHDFPIELAACSHDQLGTMLNAIDTAIGANRFLGGLCTWLDAEAPTEGDSDIHGAAAIAWADFTITASYTTSSPLA